MLPEKMNISRSELLLASGDHFESQGLDAGSFSVLPDDEVCNALVSYRKPVLAQSLWNTVSQGSFERWDAYSWAQVLVPILHQDILYGVLILGERSSGEVYSSQDLQILETVSQQAALTIANIIHAEELRGLTQQMVRSDEDQRKKVARDLHDTVLQNLFFVKQRLARSDPGDSVFHRPGDRQPQADHQGTALELA